MVLEHSSLDAFEPTLRNILIPAFNGGIDALQSKGLSMADLKISDQARRIFIRGCHYGYDKAQRKIGNLVIDYEILIRAAEEELRYKRKLRDAGARNTLRKISTLRTRQLVLRRIVDTIVYAVLIPDEWVLRRMGRREIRRIDPKC